MGFIRRVEVASTISNFYHTTQLFPFFATEPIKEGAKVAGVINEAEQQDLAEAAAEIQALLQQLEQSHPTNTTTEQMMVATQAIAQIESNPTWKQKAISAFKQGSLNVIETHPIGTFVVGAIKGWKEQQAN